MRAQEDNGSGTQQTAAGCRRHGSRGVCPLAARDPERLASPVLDHRFRSHAPDPVRNEPQKGFRP